MAVKVPSPSAGPVLSEGRNVTLVPVSELAGLPVSRRRASARAPVTFNEVTASPRSKRISWVLPSRQILSWRKSDRALTTDTPTPCRPPETL